MPLKEVIAILGASLEFEKKFNSEIIERETDEYEMPKVSQLLVLFLCYNLLKFIVSENVV